jgi:hypothetical protein
VKYDHRHLECGDFFCAERWGTVLSFLPSRIGTHIRISITKQLETSTFFIIFQGRTSEGRDVIAIKI